MARPQRGSTSKAAGDGATPVPQLRRVQQIKRITTPKPSSLPGIATKESNAYGSQGRVTAGSGLRDFGGVSHFAHAFQDDLEQGEAVGGVAAAGEVGADGDDEVLDDGPGNPVETPSVPTRYKTRYQSRVASQGLSSAPPKSKSPVVHFEEQEEDLQRIRQERTRSDFAERNFNLNLRRRNNLGIQSALDKDRNTADGDASRSFGDQREGAIPAAIHRHDYPGYDAEFSMPRAYVHEVLYRMPGVWHLAFGFTIIFAFLLAMFWGDISGFLRGSTNSLHGLTANLTTADGKPVMSAVKEVLTWNHENEIELDRKEDAVRIRLHKEIKDLEARADNLTSQAYRLEKMIKERLEIAWDLVEKVKLLQAMQASGYYLGHGVNYFCYGLNAAIDPVYTSPSLRSFSIKGLWNTLGFRENVNGPETALQPWQEPGECWCTPRTKHGLAQLSVYPAYNMTPTHFTLEHINWNTLLHRGNVPKVLEVWAEVSDAATADRLRELNEKIPGYHQPSDFPNPPGSRGTRFACVGQFTYDQDTDGIVMTKPLYPGLQELGLAPKRVVVRVLENYGGEVTCLYRVRLYGELREEVKGCREC